MSSFIGLAYEGISSFLHHKWNKALHKAVKAMDTKTTIQCNKLMQLENSMLMYGVYNAETLEKFINTVHQIHNITSSHERLFAGQQSSSTLGVFLCKCTRLTALFYKFTTLFKKQCKTNTLLYIGK